MVEFPKSYRDAKVILEDHDIKQENEEDLKSQKQGNFIIFNFYKFLNLCESRSISRYSVGA